MKKLIALTGFMMATSAGCGAPPSQIPTAAAVDEVQQLELTEKQVQAEELAHRKAIRMR